MSRYRGVSGVNREISKRYRGVNGVNREITEGYRGVNGVARQYWLDGRLVLYNRGSKLYPFTTATYTAGSNYGTKSATDEGSYVRLYVNAYTWSSGSPAGAKMQFDNVDLTNYSKLHCVVKFIALTAPENSCFDIQVGNVIHSYGYITGDNTLAYAQAKSATLNVEQTFTLDVSGITGKQYILLRANAAQSSSSGSAKIDAYIYEVYLEK